MKTRIKHKEGIGYFAQVKVGLFCWKTIGKHTNGYCLYPNGYESHPLDTLAFAKHRIASYITWKAKDNNEIFYLYEGED